MSSPAGYVLGSADAEVARLDAQAAMLAGPTQLLLQAAGIGPGMRVLDLGTGLGHVAFAVADLVGPRGAVVGIDQAAPLLEVAESRRRAAGLDHVRFAAGDARRFADGDPFDAVVARLLLFHLPDAVSVLRRHRHTVRPEGVMAVLDFDLGSARSEPVIPLAATALGWVEAAFRAAGADPRIGTRLAALLREAGFADVASFGVQSYLAADDPRGPALLAGVVRALAGPGAAAGLATEPELELDTLEARIARDLQTAGAVLLPPALVGAWGRRAAGGER